MSFTNCEKKLIVEFIIRNEAHYNTKNSVVMWEAMSEGFNNRTGHQLQKYFIKNMMPNLINLNIGVAKTDLALIKLAYLQMCQEEDDDVDEEGLEECARILDYVAMDKATRERERRSVKK